MYDHYIALDWSQKVMAFARLTEGSSFVDQQELPSNVREFQLYLSRLRGKKILTFEETTTSQWLYTELREYVDELIICDPWRNRLLLDGPKTDRRDAQKLALLLRGNLLKPVFHSGDQFLQLRKLVSGYRDLVQALVRVQCQRGALFRAEGLPYSAELPKKSIPEFVQAGVDRRLELYTQEKERYETEFKRLTKVHRCLRNLQSLPGIGLIGSMKIAAQVVDPSRFPNRGAFWSYCGLVRLEKMSGGRSYGKRTPRYCRVLKEVFKTGAQTAANPKWKAVRPNPLHSYFLYLVQEKGYPEWKARHACARRLATLALGVLKSGKPYKHSLKEGRSHHKRKPTVSLPTDLQNASA